MDENKQKINCTVESCTFQNSEDSTCSLEEIDVGCIDNSIAYDSSDTLCNSFLARDNEEFAIEYYFED